MNQQAKCFERLVVKRLVQRYVNREISATMLLMELSGIMRTCNGDQFEDEEFMTFLAGVHSVVCDGVLRGSEAELIAELSKLIAEPACSKP